MLNIYIYVCWSSYIPWFVKHIQLIFKLSDRVKQKGYNETHGIVSKVSFSNIEITFLLLPLRVLFKNDFCLDLFIEDIIDWIVSLQISCWYPNSLCDCPSCYHIHQPHWACFAIVWSALFYHITIAHTFLLLRNSYNTSTPLFFFPWPRSFRLQLKF